MTNTIRLAKRVAEQLLCSRTQADEYIEGGWIAVDGLVVEAIGARVAPDQAVALLPNAILAPVTAVTLLLHKPAGVRALSFLDPEQDGITLANLAPDDRSGLRFLRRHTRALTLATPLEDDASGLLVLTQDWRIERSLVTQANRVEQEFSVEVEGTLAPDGLQRMQQDLIWNGKPMPPLKASWQSEQRLRLAIKGAERGMIASLCSQVGLQVRSIKRLRIGRIPLAGLPPGQWRYLLGYERF